MSRRDLATGFGLVLMTSACGTVTSYQSAEPVATGRWRVAAAISGGRFVDREQDSHTPMVQGELEVRRGLAVDVDLGLKLYTVGVEASARWRIVDGRWAWALLGGIGGMRNKGQALVSDGVLVHARVGAVATRRTSAQWAFSVGPGLTLSRYSFDGGGAEAGALLGVTANAERTLGTRWRLVPELGLHSTVAGEVPVRGFIGYVGLGVALDL